MPVIKFRRLRTNTAAISCRIQQFHGIVIFAQVCQLSGEAVLLENQRCDNASQVLLRQLWNSW
jgi:hypothetical protein